MWRGWSQWKLFKLLLELELKLDAVAMARGLLSQAALTK